MEAKFGPLRKDKKRLTSIERKFFRRTVGTPLVTTKRMKTFWKSWK